MALSYANTTTTVWYPADVWSSTAGTNTVRDIGYYGSTSIVTTGQRAYSYRPPARPVFVIVPHTYPGQQSRRGRPVWVRPVSAMPPRIPTTMPRRWRDFRRDR